jgi:RNA polymerase sigma-70 factor (ECF subfamily)
MKDFSIAYKELYPKVFAYLLKCTKNYTVAEDLASESLIRVYKNYYKIDHTTNKIDRYAIVIAKNIFYDYCAKKRLNTISVQDYLDDRGNEFIQIPDRNYNPMERMISNETMVKVEELISDLPDKTRELIEMYYLDELKLKEIGNLTDIPEGTIKSRIFNTRKKLSEKLIHYKFAS